MKYVLSLWVLLSVFHALGQSDYERAVRLFEDADSIRYAEDNRLEKDHDNYKLAIQKFEEAHDLFNGVDSTYFGFRSEVGVLKCEFKIQALDFGTIRNLKHRLILDGVEDSLLGQVYFHEGVSKAWRNELDSSIESFTHAKAFFEKYKSSNKEQVNVFWFLGYVYSKKGDHDLRFKYYREALSHLALLPMNHFRVRSDYLLNRNSFEYHVMNGSVAKFWEVFYHCRNLLSIYPESFGKKDFAELYEKAGRQLRNMGFFKKSQKFLDQSFNYLDLGWSIRNTYALIYTEDKKYSKAIEILEGLLLNDLSPRQKAIVFTNLGSNYMKLRNFDEAEKFLNVAIHINDSLGRELGMGISLGNLAEIYLDQGKLDIAKRYIEESFKQYPDYKDELSQLLSYYYFRKSEIDSAIHFAKVSVLDKKGDIYLDIIVPGSLTELLDRSNWLLNVIEYSHLNKSCSDCMETLELYSKFHTFFMNFTFGHDHFDFNFIETLGRIYEQGIRHSLLFARSTDSAKYLNKAFQFSEWSKVHSLQRAKKISQAKFLAGLPETLIDKERSLKVDENYFKSQLSRFGNVEDPDSSRLARYRNRLSKITESQDSLENIIRINYPRYHQLRYQDITLSVEEVQDRLTPNQAFVEYYEGDTTSFVFTITKDDYQVKRIHLDDDTLITMYREFFEPEHFQPEHVQVNDLSYQIYKNYLQPAIGELDTTISELVVVPDGKLSYVPLDILLTRPAHDKDAEVVPYLLRDYQVHYTYSASLYFNDFSTLSTKNQYLAFAPEYAATLTDTASINRLGTFRNQVTSLKHNQEEVAYISENFKGLGFFGANANERNFKDKVDEYGVLHLAMHTIVDDEDPMNSKLVFSNSKDSLEDDLLHAFEIYNMEIPSQLAVLSACETGFGQLAKGEGALSLARAFSYAGSPSVVMSHWPVDDQTTATLMKSFYGYLADGLTKSNALRKAKLDFLDQTHSARAHPFFWGSFVVMGDDAPVNLRRLPQVNPFWVLMVCLLVLGSTGFVLHKYEL